MEGKDSQQDKGTYNCLHGGSNKRKRAYKLASLIRAVASSKRARSQKVRAYQSMNDASADWNTKLSKELLSQAQEQEDECSENESCMVVKSPSRFLYYEKGEWLDFPGDATLMLSENLRAGRSVAEVLVWGCMHLVNFLFMIQINTVTGYRRSIAWIDENGKCVFPSLPFEGWSLNCDNQNLMQENGASATEGLFDEVSNGLQSPSQIDQKGLMPKAKQSHKVDSVANGFNSTYIKPKEVFTDPVKLQTPRCSEESDSDAESVVSCHLPQTRELVAEAIAGDRPTVREACEDPRLGEGPTIWEACRYLQGGDVSITQEAFRYPQAGDNLVKLDEDDERFVLIKNSFVRGLGLLQKDACVKAIYHHSRTSACSQARWLAFHRQLEVTKQLRGDPNVRYCWHGTSKETVCEIVSHGFGQPKNGAAFGTGVYLAPEEHSHVSAIYSDYDENSEQHALFCKVIVGNTELVGRGSEQCHASSEDYDTGVDNLLKPKRHIVWSTHMNTHILPLYVVTFKLAPEWRELLLALREKNPTFPRSISQVNHIRDDQLGLQSKILPSDLKSQSISFPHLLSTLKSKLPEKVILFLHGQYLRFKAERISKLQLLAVLRRVVGDEVLQYAFMSLKEQVWSLTEATSKLEAKRPHVMTSGVCYTNQVCFD
ncbi:hypothetical protein O6H91_Y211700 [Diphasiastrum complanatum]|nr:hypothetical protein O6H91_Y211700 [Diphasiastrum complanatum]